MTGIASAAALAAQGFKVFAIKAGSKYPPLWRDWPNRATSDPQAVDFPDGCNVAIHCDGLLVLDVDPRNGGDASLLTLDLDTAGLTNTLQCQTPTGGLHLFYRLPEGHPGVPNSAGKLGPGLDVKSTRGYVVGAGSRTEKGEYRWQNPGTPIAPAPDWLVQKLGVSTTGVRLEKVDVPDADEQAVARARDWLQTRPIGDEGFRTALGLRDMGLSEAQALALLIPYDGRPEAVLAFKVRNAYTYGTGTPGAKAVTAGDFPDIPNMGTNLPNLGTEENLGTSAQVLMPPPVRETLQKVGGLPLRLGELASRRVEGPGYLVKGLLSKASYAEIYGPPGSGKTFMALDIAYHVAAGTPWMSRKVRQGSVLYLAYEGTGGLTKRAQALRQRYGDADVPLYVMSAAFNLREQPGRKDIGCIIAALPEKPALIVIDTFARALMGGDENSAQDVGAFNQAVAALIEATGACVLILHHTGKDAKRGARGSSALQGALDTEIAIDGRMLEPTKQRDIEMGNPIGFKLTTVMVGYDEDDDDVTSCVVDSAPITADAPDGRSLKGNTKSGWDALVTLSPSNEPVSVDAWRDACAEFLARGRLRQAFYDIRTRLERMKLIVVEGGMVTRRME